MKMKYFILILLFIPLLACSQDYNYKDGYRFIKKAEKALKNDKIKKAENLLKKASNSNYGFCGNAWASAEGSIDLLKAQIANKKKNYDKALMILDSIGGCSLGADCNKRDSLKIETLFLKYGKNKVVDSFGLLEKVEKNENEYNDTYTVNLTELNYKFTFGGGFTVTYVDENGEAIKQKTTDNEFVKIARNYPFYKLIEK